RLLALGGRDVQPRRDRRGEDVTRKERFMRRFGIHRLLLTVALLVVSGLVGAAAPAQASNGSSVTEVRATGYPYPHPRYLPAPGTGGWAPQPPPASPGPSSWGSVVRTRRWGGSTSTRSSVPSRPSSKPPTFVRAARSFARSSNATSARRTTQSLTQPGSVTA